MSEKQAPVRQLSSDVRQRLGEGITPDSIPGVDEVSIGLALEQAWRLEEPSRSKAITLVFDLNPGAVTGHMLGQDDVTLVFA
ncbi:MAG TPA: hypothetical protein VMW29_02220 [Candidatus Bathyarchaeia archaeon]|nr:hypothetical protein [Candidatus Bathyarchaeia archaeon]